MQWLGSQQYALSSQTLQVLAILGGLSSYSLISICFKPFRPADIIQVLLTSLLLTIYTQILPVNAFLPARRICIRNPKTSGYNSSLLSNGTSLVIMEPRRVSESGITAEYDLPALGVIFGSRKRPLGCAGQVG